MESTKEKKANGLDRAELEKIASLPDAQVAISLYNAVCVNAMGRKAAPPTVTYSYGVYDHTGHKAADSRVRVTSAAGLEIPAGRTLRQEPDGQYIGKTGSRQEVCGRYTLYFELNDGLPPVMFVLVEGSRGPQRWDAAANKHVDTLIEEAVNIGHGFKTVDTATSKRLFCFLELHPANHGSPFRNPEDCSRHGFTVTTDEEHVQRGVKIRTDVKLAVETARVMDEARELEMFNKLNVCDPVTLRKTARACGMGAISQDTDMVMQFRVFLKAIIQSKDPAMRNKQDIVKSALSGDEEYVGRLVNDAARLGVLTTSDGEYYFEGRHWDAFICPESRTGEELDHLAAILSTPGHQPWIDQLDTAVTVAKNEARKSDEVFEQHDREIDAALASKIIVKNKNKWAVKDVNGNLHDLVTIAIGSYEKQLDGLKAWARNQNIEKLKESLALLYAVE